MTDDIGRKLFSDSWFDVLRLVVNSPDFNSLGNFLESERKTHTIYPDKENIFRAFRETPFNYVRVVIITQDPYHSGAANGLAFAHNLDYKGIQPSLRNIFKEVVDDVYGGFNPSLETDKDLLHWAKQGVLLLNTTLTVRKGEPNSHSGKWDFFTNAVIKALVNRHINLIFMLWGNNAKSLKPLIGHNQIILEAGHPASGCYGKDLFSGCKHFSQTNKYLEGWNGRECIIKW